ncbi:MAG: hypothetical protein KDC26_09865 [Armatimonadetes bacterium]|nr:hypothetical protein [Armatimonadota bacterium]
MATAQHDHSHSHHIIPMPVLIGNLVLLGFLMGATIWAAQSLPAMLHSSGLPDAQISLIMNIVALTIAFLKAGFVIAIFMGVKYTTKLVKLYAIGGFVWFCLMFIMFADYATRPMEPVHGWEPEIPSALPRNTSEIPD